MLLRRLDGHNNRLTSDGRSTTRTTTKAIASRARASRAPADDYTTEYTWDHDNRLTKLTYNNGGTITKQIDYTYDLFGRRISKTTDWDGAGGGSAVVIHYVYDGEDIVLAVDGDGDLTNRYLHGPAVDQILADEQVWRRRPLAAGRQPGQRPRHRRFHRSRYLATDRSR